MLDIVRLVATWMEVPASTRRGANVALLGGVFYLGVAYWHFWARTVGASAWPSLLLASLALGSIAAGVGLLRVRPNSWSVSHTYFVVLGMGNLALVPLMFGLSIYLVPVGGGLCVTILVRLQTEDAFAIAEPEAQAQRPKPVVFRRRRV